MDGISPDLKERLSERLRNHPIAAMLHPTIEDLSLDGCVLRMPFRPEVSNGYGAVHGGVLATLADSAMAFALSTNFDGEMGFATADLTIHYFKRARTDVTARARVVKKGKRINVGIIDLYDTGGDLVATVLTSFLLTDPADAAECDAL
ncbi:MAG TPA: PaaI family thioesterase [Thermoanaerobaculia bacterium]|jgi:uncharacterized protein (TIGR00369 family)|nr:PaaI family thioesterase [Thermoanaerobaculia bacterium]